MINHLFCCYTGLVAPTAVWICLGFKIFTNPVVDVIGNVIRYVFMFIPTFNFGRSIMAVAQVSFLCLEINIASSNK